MNTDKTEPHNLMLFIDGSVNPQSKTGYGACLSIEDKDQPNLIKQDISKLVRVKRFDGTSSTKLELQTFIWAIGNRQHKEYKINIYTDCQNFFSLLNRRTRLEENAFHTKTGKLINNAELYQIFFNIIDTYNCSFHKVEGHKTSKSKDDIDRLFTIVDRASRGALRNSNLSEL